jgi:hypothetical protein
VLDGSGRAFALADRRRDLRVAEPLDEPQEDDLALVLAESGDGRVQLADLVAGEQVVLRVGESRSLGYLAIGQIVETDLGTALAVVVDHEVVGETKQPGAVGQPPLLVARHRLPGLEENLFGQILGLGGAADSVGDVAIHAIDVLFVQLTKRIRIASLGLRYQRRFGGIAALVSFLPQHSHPPYYNVKG